MTGNAGRTTPLTLPPGEGGPKGRVRHAATPPRDVHAITTRPPSPQPSPGRRGSRNAALIIAALLAPAAPAQDDPLPPILPRAAGQDLASQLRIRVERFDFDGNTVFTDDELAEVVRPFAGRDVTSEELEEARLAITKHYVDRGYINSGALLPDQDVADGVIRFQVVEGKLTEVVVKGNRQLQQRFIRDRAALGVTDRPLNVLALRDSLEMLRQKPVLTRINAELKPGGLPGEGLLEVSVEEAQPYHAYLRFHNERSPSLGAERFELLADHLNLTGRGDSLFLRYGLTTGGIEDIEFAGLDEIGGTYVLPITAHDTTLAFSYNRSTTLVIEEPLADLDIESETQDAGIVLRHPLWRTPANEFALSLGFDWRQNETFLLGEPFSFSRGAIDGETRVAAVRFAQEYLTRSRRRALALRSQFNFGVDALDATATGDEPDAQFFSWLGQFQWVERLGDSPHSLVFRSALQLSPEPLVSLEQFSVGGMNSVRGYRENRLVRDSAGFVSLEARLAVITDKDGQPIVTLAPFIDFGGGWNESEDEGGADTIGSAGVGVLLDLGDRLDAQLYYGHPFRNFSDPEDDLQDVGIHFNVLLRMF